MNNLKHVGRFIRNGRKCLVAYRTLPGDAYNCLVIPTESLDDSYHDSLIKLVESNSAQNANEFAEVLSRNNFPDGSVMLAYLHKQGKLVKAPTSEIEMLPNFTSRVRLDELNQVIAEQLGVSVSDLAITDPRNINADAVNKTEVVDIAKVEEVKPPSLELEENLSIEERATKLRGQADKLSKQAAELRRQAEELVPTKKNASKKAQ